MKAITEETIAEEGEKNGEKKVKNISGLENYRDIWTFQENYFRLDGRTAEKERNIIIENFNQSKLARVFLISTKAGGQGINLTSANRVVLLDTSWNPSTDRECNE